MKIILDKPYNMLAVGDEMDVSAGIAQELIKRKVAHTKNDPDGDGKAEGGLAGIKKAFSSPDWRRGPGRPRKQ